MLFLKITGLIRDQQVAQREKEDSAASRQVTPNSLGPEKPYLVYVACPGINMNNHINR